MKKLASIIMILVLVANGRLCEAQPENSERSPIKVFLLVGQSNMQGHARIHTLEHLGMSSNTLPLFQMLANADNSPKTIDNVWINSLSSGGVKRGQLTAGFGAADDKIGPELAFGAYMQKYLNEPVVIIKTSWGGKSLNTDFRSPGSGPYEFSEEQLQRFKKQNKDVDQIKSQKREATGKFYRMTIQHIKSTLQDMASTYPEYDKEQGYELAGVVWFQGWNDLVDGGFYRNRGKQGGYSKYSQLLSNFIRDIRKDLSTPDLPFVIGVLGVGGPTEKYGPDQKRYQMIHQNFRDAMAAPAQLPEFKNNVAAVYTENYWDNELAQLRKRQAKIHNQSRKTAQEEKLDRQAARALREKLEREEFSEQERKVLEKGISNLEFHYLGSAKIMAQIGKGFAEAMRDLRK